MPKYTNSATVTVPAGGIVPFTNNAIPCNKGCVLHDAGSGQITLRAPANGCRARYKVTFSGNIAVATGGTAGPISVGLAVNGEPLYPDIATATPAAVGNFFNVAISELIDVQGCCKTISIVNATSPTATGAAGPAIDVANASLIVTREA